MCEVVTLAPPRSQRATCQPRLGAPQNHTHWAWFTLSPNPCLPLLVPCHLSTGFLIGVTTPKNKGSAAAATLKDSTAIRVGDTALKESVIGMVSFRIPALPGPILTGRLELVSLGKPVGQNPLSTKTLWSGGKPAAVKIHQVGWRFHFVETRVHPLPLLVPAGSLRPTNSWDRAPPCRHRGLYN